MSNVAKTIIKQIKSIDFLALASWGAKDFVSGDNYLRFETTGFRVKGSNKHVIVKLTNQDLYDIEIGYFQRSTYKWIITANDKNIFADQLVLLIDNLLTK